MRAPAIKDLLNSGALQLTLFDQRDMASITAPDFPGERLVVCRNPDFAAERARKREDLLAATERDLARIKAAVGRKRNPLRGTAEIALAVGEVFNTHKMRKHFDLDITDTAFSFARKTAAIAAEAAFDGLYVVRTNLSEAALDDAATVRSYKSLARMEEMFRALKSDGMGLEETQMHAAGRLFKQAVVGLAAAYRTVQLVDARDGGPRPATDVIDPALLSVAEAIGPTLEGKTERQKNRHPPHWLAWLAWIVARLPSCPESVQSTDRGKSRLQRAQQNDQPRYADLRPYQISREAEGQMPPKRSSCANAS